MLRPKPSNFLSAVTEEDLKAAIAFKQNHVKSMKGGQKMADNWEICVVWFIGKYAVIAVFRTQNRRTNVVDPRRTPLHLMKALAAGSGG